MPSLCRPETIAKLIVKLGELTISYPNEDRGWLLLVTQLRNLEHVIYGSCRGGSACVGDEAEYELVRSRSEEGRAFPEFPEFPMPKLRELLIAGTYRGEILLTHIRAPSLCTLAYVGPLSIALSNFITKSGCQLLALRIGTLASTSGHYHLRLVPTHRVPSPADSASTASLRGRDSQERAPRLRRMSHHREGGATNCYPILHLLMRFKQVRDDEPPQWDRFPSLAHLELNGFTASIEAVVDTLESRRAQCDLDPGTAATRLLSCRLKSMKSSHLRFSPAEVNDILDKYARRRKLAQRSTASADLFGTIPRLPRSLREFRINDACAIPKSWRCSAGAIYQSRAELEEWAGGIFP